MSPILQSRLLRISLAVAVVAIGTLVGTLLYVRQARDRACEAWHRALAAQTTETTVSLGGQTAAQFRLEAIRRGWVDRGGRRVTRPSGCQP
jgi:hypothetical protein